MHALSNKQLVLVGVGLIVILFFFALLSTWPSSQPENPATSTNASQTLSPPTPPTQAQLQQLQNAPAFQYLVSYTQGGFQPSHLAVKKGDTVRFANNFSGQLWVASVGEGPDPIYPGTSSCNGSAFDSCGPIDRGGYWEFTFTESGTWDFENNLNKSDMGTITVQ